MSIDEQVKQLREESEFIRETIEKDYPVTIAQAELMEQAADTIERLNTGWISVDEKLPPVGEDILVCDMDGDIYKTHRIIDGANQFRCYDESGNKIKGICAWRRIPEPYNGGEG